MTAAKTSTAAKYFYAWSFQYGTVYRVAPEDEAAAERYVDKCANHLKFEGGNDARWLTGREAQSISRGWRNLAEFNPSDFE